MTSDEKNRMGTDRGSPGGADSEVTSTAAAGVAERENDTFRTEAFSDAVMAIAITLLVIELRVPPPEGGEFLWAALLHEWPSFAVYATSFATIGVVWANHHVMFGYIRRAGWGLLLLNTLFLAFVALIPFPTALLAEYAREDAHRTAAVVVYCANFFAMALAFNALWRYAARGGYRDLDPGAARRAVERITRRFTVGPLIYLVGIPLAFVRPELGMAANAVAAAVFLAPPGADRPPGQTVRRGIPVPRRDSSGQDRSEAPRSR